LGIYQWLYLHVGGLTDASPYRTELTPIGRWRPGSQVYWSAWTGVIL